MMPQKFEFICSGPSITFNDDVKFAARSHTAKVNRRKRTQIRRPRAAPLLGVQPTPSAALLTPTGLGAGKCQGQDLSSPNVVDTVDFLFRGSLAAAFTQDEIRNWFKGFCESPMLFYAWTHHRGFIEYRQRGFLSELHWQRLISTRCSAYPLIQNSVAEAGNDQSSIENLLLAMAITSPCESDSTVSDDLALIRPLVLYEEGLDVFRTRLMPGFLPAAALLLKRLPRGVKSLQDQGLLRMMCMLDLVSAASDFSRPLLPCGWEPPLPMDRELYANETLPGDGFARLGSSQLPGLDTFLNICRLESFIAQYRRLHLNSTDFLHLMDWRNSAIHELLSLPDWEHLPAEAKAASLPDFYECCRLTTILYTNAVICAIPAQSSGIMEPLYRLTILSKESKFTTWRHDLQFVAIWSMFVSGIVAYNTFYWPSIVHALRELLQVHKFPSLASIHLTLKHFLWSDSATAAGMKVLWDAVNSGNTGPVLVQAVD